MQDTSTPSPSDPEHSDSGNGDTSPSPPKKSLKLKRIIIEDTKINPHKKETDEPTPEAQPFEEPEEPPVPEEFRQVKPPVPIEGNQESDQESVPEPPPDADEEEDPEEIPIAREPAPTAAKEPKSPLKRLLFVLIPAALLAGILLLLNQIFEPFGSELTRIQPQDQPVLNAQTESTEAPEQTETGRLEVSEIPKAVSTISASSFVEALKGRKIMGSSDPKGIFIGPVFIPEGQTVNPEIGITLSAVTIGDFESFAVLSSPSGESFTLVIESENK